MSDRAVYESDRVNDIARNLHERYKRGFPILKELVQNADDAKATALIFGHHLGLNENVKNPLLNGPALWMINNGEFTADDAECIKAFGFNAKAADSGAIGKFGLGMKSVFHLCEAFFYVANDGVKLHHKVLSPWFRGNQNDDLDLHKSWGTITEQDKFALNQLVDQVVTAHPDFHASQENKTWFLLWIPLRRREHVPPSTAPIIAQYPGETHGETIDLDFLNDPNVNVSQRLGHLLPLLRNLERVSFLGTAHKAAFFLTLRVEEGARKQLVHESDSLKLRGWTQDGCPKPEALHFSVKQKKSDKKCFVELKEADAWPKRMTIVGQDRKPEPDKAQAEGAVMISHAKKRKGKLIIQWAVFLPTDDDGDGTYRVDIPNSSTEFHIVLHAQFFVDSGRRGIEGMNKLTEQISESMPLKPSASELPVLWNKLLAQRLVLPMVLPALADYVEQQRLGNNEIDALVKAISETRLGGKDFIPFVCVDHVFVQQLVETTSPAWKLLPLNQGIRLLPLPAPRNNDHSRPWIAMPGLRNIKNAVFVDSNAPRLSRPLASWDVDSLIKVLDRLTVQTITTQTSLAYLVDFLQTERDRFLNAEEVQTVFVQRLRQALLNCDLSDLRKHRDVFKNFVGLINEKQVYGLGVKGTSAKSALPESIFKKLLAVDNNVILLPADLINASNASLDVTAVEPWLEVLNGKNWSDEYATACLSAAEELLNCLPKTDKTTSSEQFQLLQRHPDWALIKVWNAREGGEVAACLHEVNDAKKRGHLFKIADATDKYGLLPLLIKALPDSNPLVLSSNQWIYWVSEGNTPLPNTRDAIAIIRSIGGADFGPTLNSDTLIREEFLSKLVNNVKKEDKNIVKGIRYLLHGNSSFFRDVETTLWHDAEKGKSPWAKIWQMNLPSEKRWTVLSDELVGAILGNMHEALGIKPVKKETVISQLIGSPNFSNIDSQEFSSEEIDTILGEFNDEKLWRDLPLHQDQHGQRKPLGPDAYFGEKFKLPSGVGDKLRFIKPSNDKHHLQKQKEYIKPWNESAAIEAVLSCAHPEQHWEYVLNIFPNDPSPDAVEVMQEIPWLPLKSGGVVGLNQLFSISHMDEELSLLTDSGRWTAVGNLFDPVKEHKSFDKIRKFIATDKKAFSAASEIIKGKRFFVGASVNLTADQLKERVGFLAKIEGILPAWRWMQKMMEAFPSDAIDVLHDFLPGLQLQLNTSICEQVLAFIADEAGEQPLEKIWREIFVTYLREWVNSDGVELLKNKLPHLRLLTEDGYFLKANLLVSGVHGVVPSSCLHHDLINVLGGIVHQNDVNVYRTTSDVEIHASYVPRKPLASALEEWASDLNQTSVAPAVGALMGVFGEQTTEIACQWLKPIAYDVFLEKLNWKDPGCKNGDIRDFHWMGGKAKPSDGFGIIRPRLKIQDGSHIHAFNLIGCSIDVELKSSNDLSNLLAGSLMWLGGCDVEVMLRPVDGLLMRSLTDQKNILKLTAETLYKELYNQPHADFSDLWRDFDQSDQVELDIAASLILDGLPQMLEGLSGAKKDEKIKCCLDAYDQARRDAANAKNAHSKSADNKKNKKQQKLDELAELLKHDADVQRAILLGVRERVKHNHYELSSIPFEVLQNADDAVSEYQEMQTKSGRMLAETEDIGRFVLCSDRNEKRVLLMHWGRPINYTGHSTAPDVYNSDYAKDLEHMLMLGASGKSGESETTTGKFGLGFKSVLLAVDAPIVSSGDLQFQIVAGCLPVKAAHSDWAAGLKRQHPSAGRLRSTAVELANLKNPRDVVQRFERLAGLCTVFLRHVHHIRIEVDAASTTHEWKPKTIYQDQLAWCEMGKVQLPTETSSSQADSMVGMLTADLLVLRRGRVADGESDAALAVRLAHGGVVPFADRDVCVPAIWVNAPTRGTNAQGFVLNAKFEVDTGRGSLPQGEVAHGNSETAKKLADDLSPLVQHWFDGTRHQWPEYAEKLNGLAASSPAAFWQSWWKTLMGHSPSADASADVKLADAFACRLFDRFVERTGCVPNGLAGKELALVSVQSLCLVVTDAQRKSVLPALTEWPKFQQQYPAAGWCSSEVRGWLERVGRCPESLKELSRGVVLGVLGAPAKLQPDDVNDLMAVIRVWPERQNNEWLWKKELESLQLQNRLGEWKPLKAFCTWVSKSNPLADFASATALTDKAYEEQQDWEALVSLLVEPTPSVTDLVNWCGQADSDNAKTAVLTWLLANLNHLIWSYLRTHNYGWMKQLSLESELLKKFSDEDMKKLLSNLGLLTNENLIKHYGGSSESEQTSTSKALEGLTLQAIHCWWGNERTKHIDKYDRGFWPQDIDRQQLNELPIDRSAWMTLFTLAVVRMFGRATDEQHRGFIELLNQRGWWDTIAFTDPEADAQSWMNILREYAEGSGFKADYEMWMDSFPRIYRMARWCEPYAELFCGLDRRDPTEARRLLTPSSDSSLSGSGFDAPTLHRTLKAGHPLVIRELLRAGVLKFSVAKRMAYMPTQPVKELLQSILGSDATESIQSSEDIFEALSLDLNEESATFFGDYDIPLIVLSRSTELQQHVAKVYGAAGLDAANDWGDEE